MNCELCRDMVIETFIMPDDSRIIGYNRWVAMGTPLYKDTYVERCAKCFPVWSERHSNLVEKYQNAIKAKDELSAGILRIKIREHYDA